ncbi:MAG: glycosyltransferase family 1 protein [Pseudomonadota bacterium]
MQSTDRAAETRKLRVALFSGNYNYVMDGPVRALNTLVAHLERRGHEVLVFAPTSKKSYLDHAGTLVSAPSIALPQRSEYRLGLGLMGAPMERLKRFSPNLIHLSAPDLIGLSALRFARKNFIPAVASFHTRFDTYPRYYGAAWLEKYLTNYMRYFYKQCEHVYPPSQSMADELAAEGIGRDIRLWTRGVDGDLFNPNKRDLAWRRSVGIEDDAIVVLFVGRLVLEKGLDAFADAVDSAASVNRRIRALVVGEGPERAAFEKRMPTAVFTGFQDGEGLARAYASSDIFFNPSITETFGNVTLEAMSSGLPSVCASAAGSLSLVEDGATGLIAEPNVTDFARKLLLLAQTKEPRLSYGAGARAKASEYSWETLLDGLISNYYEAMDSYLRTHKQNTSGRKAKGREAA